MMIVKELWQFLVIRKKIWLFFLIFFLSFFGSLMFIAQSSALAPYIYTLF